MVCAACQRGALRIPNAAFLISIDALLTCSKPGRRSAAKLLTRDEARRRRRTLPSCWDWCAGADKSASVRDNADGPEPDRRKSERVGQGEWSSC
jgi:hypothetical protein